MSIEWQIIFLQVVIAAAYFSYRAGFSAGRDEGIDALLDSLEAQGIIDIQEVEDDQ